MREWLRPPLSDREMSTYTWAIAGMVLAGVVVNALLGHGEVSPSETLFLLAMAVMPLVLAVAGVDGYHRAREGYGEREVVPLRRMAQVWVWMFTTHPRVRGLYRGLLASVVAAGGGHLNALDLSDLVLVWIEARPTAG